MKSVANGESLCYIIKSEHSLIRPPCANDIFPIPLRNFRTLFVGLHDQFVAKNVIHVVR